MCRRFESGDQGAQGARRARKRAAQSLPEFWYENGRVHVIGHDHKGIE
jgi:hypothetical protein